MLYRCLFASSSVCLLAVCSPACLCVHVDLHVCTNPKSDAASMFRILPVVMSMFRGRPQIEGLNVYIDVCLHRRRFVC